MTVELSLEHEDKTVGELAILTVGKSLVGECRLENVPADELMQLHVSIVNINAHNLGVEELILYSVVAVVNMTILISGGYAIDEVCQRCSGPLPAHTLVVNCGRLLLITIVGESHIEFKVVTVSI